MYTEFLNKYTVIMYGMRFIENGSKINEVQVSLVRQEYILF